MSTVKRMPNLEAKLTVDTSEAKKELSELEQAIDRIVEKSNEVLPCLKNLTQKANHLPNWIPCSDRLPNGNEAEIPCLVTCRERDLFSGRYGEKEVQILSFSIKDIDWNTKADIIVEAWTPLPKPY